MLVFLTLITLFLNRVILFFCERTFLTNSLKYAIIYVSMGVDGMYKNELIYIISEILFSIFIIVFGYIIWSGFDQTDYNIAKHYDNTREVDLVYESNHDKGYVGNNVVIT